MNCFVNILFPKNLICFQLTLTRMIIGFGRRFRIFAPLGHCWIQCIGSGHWEQNCAVWSACLLGWSNYFGASLLALKKLGDSKGYTLVCCDNSGTNAFFVRNDLIQKELHRSRYKTDLSTIWVWSESRWTAYGSFTQFKSHDRRLKKIWWRSAKRCWSTRNFGRLNMCQTL